MNRTVVKVQEIFTPSIAAPEEVLLVGIYQGEKIGEKTFNLKNEVYNVFAKQLFVKECFEKLKEKGIG